MPDWVDKGIVLSVRKYGEKGLIANILTEEHGRHLGWLSSRSNNTLSHIQPGNLVSVFWKSRLIEQMGNFKIELISSVSGKMFDDKLKLQALSSLCALIEKILPERQKYQEIYNATLAFVNLLLLDDNIKINKSFVRSGDYNVAVIHSDTINNEKNLTKNIIQQISDDAVDFISLSIRKK